MFTFRPITWNLAFVCYDIIKFTYLQRCHWPSGLTLAMDGLRARLLPDPRRPSPRCDDRLFYNKHYTSLTSLLSRPECCQQLYLLTPMNPRAAASLPIDHRAEHRAGRRLWSTSDDRRSMLTAPGHVRRRRQVLSLTGRQLSLLCRTWRRWTCHVCPNLQSPEFGTKFLIIDRVAGEIIRLVASVCVSVRLSVCVSMFAVGTLLFEPFDLDFWHEGRPWQWLAWYCRPRSRS